MLFKEKIAVYYENHTEPINTSCRKYSELLNIKIYDTRKQVYAVQQHTYGGAAGRGGIAPHSRPRHWMGVSAQRHAPAALYPRGKDPRYPLYRRLGGPQSRSGFGG
jgi:hypothetical protein